MFSLYICTFHFSIYYGIQRMLKKKPRTICKYAGAVVAGVEGMNTGTGSMHRVADRERLWSTSLRGLAYKRDLQNSTLNFREQGQRSR